MSVSNITRAPNFISLPLIDKLYNLCYISNCFVTKLLKFILLDAILKFKIFTNVINNYLDRQYISGYFPNAILCTLFKIISKIPILNDGHFELQIAVPLSKI